MSKKSKKFDANPAPEADAVTPTLSAAELSNGGQAENTPSEPKKERAPRIVRPRFRLINAADPETEIHFTHYALPTRRAPAGKIMIDGVETEFTVTKSQSRDKTEDRAYSYFKLPNGATGYVAQELAVGAELTSKELPPAEPFGGKRGGKSAEAAPSSTEPQAEAA